MDKEKAPPDERALTEDLSGEDLSRGPTPETRHPAGHVEGRDFAEGDSESGETGGDDDIRDTPRARRPRPGRRCVQQMTTRQRLASRMPTWRREPTSAATRTSS